MRKQEKIITNGKPKERSDDMNREELKDYLDGKINDVFYEYQTRENIKSGDISPLDSLCLEELEYKIVDLIISVSKCNVEDNEHLEEGNEMDWSEEKQYDVLLKFFHDCVRFWEHELKTDSDLDKAPYLEAIKEIPKNDPYVPNGRPFDAEVRNNFIKTRYMDVYGRDWERYYKGER